MVAAPQRDLPRAVELLQQLSRDAGSAVAPSSRQQPSKIWRKSSTVGLSAKILSLNSAEEGLVHELRGADVRREDNQRHERQLELLAGLQGEEVDAAFEQHDPAVEQVARRAVLTAEVVDDQHAAVRDGLHGPDRTRSSSCSSAPAGERELAPTITMGRRQVTHRRSSSLSVVTLVASYRHKRAARGSPDRTVG